MRPGEVGLQIICIVVQFGNIHVVRPEQVTFIVPGTEHFNPADIGRFVNKLEELEVHLRLF